MTDEEVVYRCWCEHDDCNWEREVVEDSNELAQRVSVAAMFGHGLETGHHETKRERVDVQKDENA